MADRYNDVLSASIGTPEHPGRLRGHALGYTKVRDVYGQGRRRSHQAQQNERIRQLESMVHTQQEMLGKLFLPAEVQQHFGGTPSTLR